MQDQVSITTKKNVSDDIIMLRFMSRFGREGHDYSGSFLPDAHLLYVRSEDALYVYERGAFVPFDDETRLQNALMDFLQKERDQFTPSMFDEKLKALHPDYEISARKLAAIAALIRMRIAQLNAIDSVDAPFVSFRNGLSLDLSKDPLVPVESSPLIRSFTYLPVDFVENPPEPTLFLGFLRHILVDQETQKTDQQLIDIVQEMFGYALLPTIEAQTAFFLVGSGANGKSTLLNILSSLFDPKFISAIRLSDMTGSSFMLSELVGKKLNIVNEEESKYVRVDTLKHLISGEPVMAMRKYKQAISFVPKTKFLWATNDIPSFDKIDPALRRRLIFIPFNRVIPLNERDSQLTNKLKEELVSILFWSLEGAKRLIKNNFHFTASDASTRLTRSVRIDRFPSLEFIDEQYEITDNKEDFVPASTLFERFRMWCDKYGYAKCSIKTFAKQVADFDMRITSTRRRISGKQVVVKTNLLARPDAEPIITEYGFTPSQNEVQPAHE